VWLTSVQSLLKIVAPLQITEHWNGTDLGREDSKLRGHNRVFRQLFNKKNGGKVDAVTLGIAAERCANTLYRLQHNGIGNLHPKVWWVLIGTNDLGGEWCSEEAILAGNIAIVQELQRLRPEAVIVINSILPKNDNEWPHLMRVNERLQCYAASTPRVEFFNSTDIFRNATDGSLMNLMDGLHPSESGSMVWGTAIVKRVLGIIQQN
jgi:lysophospholipase L1-like esterase